MESCKVKKREETATGLVLGDRSPGLLVGTPNVGKSVIFNQLTGHYAIVSNYPGTTVEVASARMGLPHGDSCLLIDTPGVNGLLPFSEDEKVSQRILLESEPSFVIHVGDAKNLARTLQLTFQIVELRRPLLLVLNMSDEAAQKGISIDTEALSERLGIDVVLTSAPEGKGIGQIPRLAAQARVGRRASLYPAPIEEALDQISSLLACNPHASRLLALFLLGRDPFIGEWLAERYDSELLGAIEELVRKTERSFSRPLNVIMASARKEAAGRLAREVSEVREPARGTVAERIGVLTRRPLTGFPVFLGIMYLMYLLVGRFAAGTLVDFLENVIFGGYVNPWAARLFGLFSWPFLNDMMVGPFGLVSMGLTYAFAIVLPIVGTFFICFGFLEDSGYLPRLSIMSNRLFRRIGLNGKAILPMVLGLGCSTMATLTARILETKKERLIVILLLALGIPCSAQLGVILAILASLSPWAALTVIGVILLQLVLVGYLAGLILPGEGSDFILEIPPIRMPRISNLFLKTYLRVEWFLKEAIPLFLLGTLVLFLAERVGLLALLERAASPLVSGWLELPPETANIFIMGFFRRDYGAAGLFSMIGDGLLTANQVVVSLVVITLFVPCIANFLVIIKEQGLKRAMAMAGFIFPFAFLVGGLLNRFLKLTGILF